MKSLEDKVINALKELCRAVPDARGGDALLRYAILVVALEEDFAEEPCIERAIVYLRDCNNDPVHARGRLLLRASERALRSAGDMPGFG